MNENEDHREESKDKEDKSPGFFSVILSVLSAMIGIQSEQNHERDFKKGQIGNYIVVGIIMVAIFIFTLITIINNILEETAK